MPSHKRNGQTMYAIWLGDMEREKWEATRKAENFTSLARFVREIVNRYIREQEGKQGQVAKNGAILAELKAQEKTLDEKFAALQEKLLIAAKAPDAAPSVDVKERILAMLEGGHPMQWTRIAKIIGGPNQVIIDSLESLLQQHLVTMTKSGEWVLNE